MDPRKKRRLMPVSGPDGFEKSAAQPGKGRNRISVPQFSSGFTPSSGNVVEKTTAKSVHKAPHSSLDPQLRNAVLPARPGGASAGPHMDFGVARAPPKPPLAPPDRDFETRSSKLKSARQDPFVIYKDVASSDGTMPTVRQDPFAMVVEDSKSTTTAITTMPHIPSAGLRELQAPDLFSIQNLKPMKRVTSPPRLSRTIEPRKNDLKTLSTTNIARATDLSTDSGNAELAAILLHDQHPELVMQGDENGSEAQRGLNFSPRKKRYGQHGGPQFVRGGLAARASQLLSRSRTSLSLWQTEMEAQTIPLIDDPLGLSCLKPDLRMKVLRIVHTPSINSSRSNSNINSSVPCFFIALCRILPSPSSSTKHGVSRPQLSFHTSYHTLVKVILSFSTFASSPRSVVRNPSHFTPGVELLVWKPWYEVKMETSTLHPSGPESEGSTENGLPGARAVSPKPPILMPASFPMPLTVSTPPDLENLGDCTIAEMALMCTRFVVDR